jgi:xanthine/CO dehydrogenase XdhC/CoxF family maturation factor
LVVRTNSAGVSVWLSISTSPQPNPDKLHGPIGLYIGSKTPPEIGLDPAELNVKKNAG